MTWGLNEEFLETTQKQDVLRKISNSNLTKVKILPVKKTLLRKLKGKSPEYIKNSRNSTVKTTVNPIRIGKYLNK